jgi:hypothetical protein
MDEYEREEEDKIREKSLDCSHALRRGVFGFWLVVLCCVVKYEALSEALGYALFLENMRIGGIRNKENGGTRNA